MISGKSDIGTYVTLLSADTSYVLAFSLPRDGWVLGVTFAADGFGPAIGDQVLTGVLYDSAGPLLSVTPESLIAERSPFSWVTLTFTTPVSVRGGEVYYAGFQTGDVSNSARISTDSTPGTCSTYADTYADGPLPVLPALTAAPSYTMWVSYSIGYDPPADATDDWLAALPFPLAQEVLGRTGTLFGSRQLAVVGWHGTLIDPERGSNCIVNPTGPLAALVGERVKVSLGARAVYAYCHTDGDILEDLSLTRRAFMALGYLATTELNAYVEIMADSL